MKRYVLTTLILSVVLLFTSLLFISNFSQEACYRLEYRVSEYNSFMVKNNSGSLNFEVEFFNPNSVDVSLYKPAAYLPNGEFELQLIFSDLTKFTPSTLTILNTASYSTFPPGISRNPSVTVKFIFQDRDGLEANHIPDGNYTISYRYDVFGFPLTIMFVSGVATYEISDLGWQSESYTPVEYTSYGQTCKFTSTSDASSQNFSYILVLLALSSLFILFLIFFFILFFRRKQLREKPDK